MFWKGIKSTSQDKQILSREQAPYSQSKAMIKDYKVTQGKKDGKDEKQLNHQVCEDEGFFLFPSPHSLP